MVSPHFYFVNSCSFGGLTRSPGCKPLPLVLYVLGARAGVEGYEAHEAHRTAEDQKLIQDCLQAGSGA